MSRLSAAHRFYVFNSFDDDKAGKAHASLSGLIIMGLLFLCLLPYHHSCTGALQLSQSTSWTHTDAQSICTIQSGYNHAISCPVGRCHCQFKVMAKTVTAFKFLNIGIINNGTVIQPLHCQFLIADHQDSHCDCCYEDDMTLMQLCTDSSGGLSVGHSDVQYKPSS
jgi:hypothetical protein